MICAESELQVSINAEARLSLHGTEQSYRSGKVELAQFSKTEILNFELGMQWEGACKGWSRSVEGGRPANSRSEHWWWQQVKVCLWSGVWCQSYQQAGRFLIPLLSKWLCTNNFHSDHTSAWCWLSSCTDSSLTFLESDSAHQLCYHFFLPGIITLWPIVTVQFDVGCMLGIITGALRDMLADMTPLLLTLCIWLIVQRIWCTSSERSRSVNSPAYLLMSIAIQLRNGAWHVDP